MSLNGSGVYVVNSAGQPVAANTLITAAAFNAFTADIAIALSSAVFKDGQQTVTANLPLGGFRLTGLGAGSAAGHSLRYEQLFTAGTVTLLGALSIPTTLGVTGASTLAGTSVTTLSASGTSTLAAVNASGNVTLSKAGSSTITSKSTDGVAAMAIDAFTGSTGRMQWLENGAIKWQWLFDGASDDLILFRSASETENARFASATGNATFANDLTVVGTLAAPITQNSKSAAYTTVLGDAGKHILHPTADNNARTFTIDSNANVAYPTGTAISFVNQINTVTIAITSDTLTLAGTGATGSRTLAANGIATALKIGATSWIISGTGLS